MNFFLLITPPGISFVQYHASEYLLIGFMEQLMQGYTEFEETDGYEYTGSEELESLRVFGGFFVLLQCR